MKNNPFSGKKYFELSYEQRIQWLRLIRSQNVGPATFRDLISRYGTAELALEAIPELAKRGGAAARIKIYSYEEAEKELAKASQFGARYIGMGEPDYPPVLRNADNCPPLLCTYGNIEILTRKAIGFVGSRNASIAGMKLTERLAGQAAEAGFAVVSGLARGIDTAAHKASCKLGTIAVFAGGVDHIFPEENRALVASIAENGGAIVSELPMGWQPRAKDFPRRNRIIAGLTVGTLVVEAARRSGSLITARLANEMGRTVLAIPGSPLDPRSEGTNQLIREGATLVTSIEEILEALAHIDPEAGDAMHSASEDEKLIYQHAYAEPDDLNANTREKIISALGPTPTTLDDIVQFTSATAGEIQLTLLELQLAGKLERHTDGSVSFLE